MFLIDLARNFRFPFERHAGNVWNAGTLEWLPTGTYQTRSIPIVTSREPLWDQPGLAEEVKAGRYYLPGRADRRARDDRDQPDRCAAAIPAADARPELVAVPRGGLHRGLFHAADGQAGHSRRRLRRDSPSSW